MDVQRYPWLVAVALMAALAGCLGGSGSSGFDITENAAIQAAIDTQKCQDFEGLVICPAESGAAVRPSPTPTPTSIPLPVTPTAAAVDTPTFPNDTPGPDTMTPTLAPVTATPTERAVETPTPVFTPGTPPPMQIATNLSASSDIVCVGGGSACSFPFLFVATGFPPDAMYRTAFREETDPAWTLSQPTETAPQSDQAIFVDDIRLAAATNAPGGSEPTVQLAVLVFLSDPGELPASVTLLGDTGADFAYVLPPVPVSQIGR